MTVTQTRITAVRARTLAPSRAILVAMLTVAFAACGDSSEPISEMNFDASVVGVAQSAGDGLYIRDLTEGSGATASTGSRVTVHYTGWLTDGQQFDSSVGGAPFEFVLGQQEVIRGWDEGVLGMKVGGRRQLVIPSELGYGAAGAGGVIPPNATLVFEVALLEVD
jgi:FKBP-type peptidyl-prolyl cis-trans isomerase FkpA